MTTPILYLPDEIWKKTWLGLRQRGRGIHEAAAVWIGQRESARELAEDVVFLDDMPGIRRGALHHCTPRTVAAALFAELRRRGKVIVGDVHTHPGTWVELSPIDQEHPIEYRIGLVAVVLPRYALGEPSLSGIGVHVYLGSGNWHSVSDPEVSEVLRLSGGSA